MAMLQISLYLLLICVCFNHASPTLRPLYPTVNTPPHPMVPPNHRPNEQTKTRPKIVTGESIWGRKGSTVAVPPPLEEPSTITSENLRSGGGWGVLEAPSTATPPILLQLLRDAGVTLSPSNSPLMSLLDRIDFESLERICRQRAGLSNSPNIFRNALDNQRAYQFNPLQSQTESKNTEALLCSFVGKLGSPDTMFRDLENVLSGLLPLKQNQNQYQYQ